MSRRLSILIGADVPPDPDAGASGTVLQMANALRRRGHDVTTFWSHDLGRRIQHGNLHYLLELPFTYQREVSRRLRSRSFDVIELNQPHAYRVAKQHFSKKRRGVFVNRSHGHEVRGEEQLQEMRERDGEVQKRGIRKAISSVIQTQLREHWNKVTRFSDGIIVSSTEDRDFLIHRYGVSSENVGVITQGVPQSFLNQPVMPLTPHRLNRIIYVGQFAFVKAPRILTQAVNRILEELATTEFTWICDQSHHAKVRELISPELRSRVRLVEYMPQRKLISELDQHGIFLFPSYFEGFGKAPLEAMSRGLCVITSDCGGMRDYIIQKRNGFRCPINDSERMAEIACALIRNAKWSQEIAIEARRTAETHTWDRCAADEEDFLMKLLDRKNQILKR